jgi:hypothetical protein
MVDTCVMCGEPVSEGTQVCYTCMHNDEHPACQECHSSLRLMHSSQATAGRFLTVTRLFHCEACHCDWEQNTTYILHSKEMKRKFWG